MPEPLSSTVRLSRKLGETARLRIVVEIGDTIAMIEWPTVSEAICRFSATNYDSQWAEAIYCFPSPGRYVITPMVTTAGQQEIRPTWVIVVN